MWTVLNKPKLTVKQKKFADEYIKTGSATEAYKSAYAVKSMSKASINTEAVRTLRKPPVKSYVESKMKKLEDAKIMDAKEALEGISAIARGELTVKGYDKDGIEVDIYPTVTERQRAYESILRRFPLSPLDKAQIKKAQADAVKSEAEAEVAKAQVQQLHAVSDNTAKKMSKLSVDDLRKLANLYGGGDND